MRGWRFAAPAMLLMVIAAGWPLGRALYLSFFRRQVAEGGRGEAVGWANYGAILSNGTWWRAVATAAVLMLVIVALQLLIGLAFAATLHRIVGINDAVRLLILVPFAVLSYVSATAWSSALDGGFASSWFGGPDSLDSWQTALAAVVLSEVWRGAGVAAVFIVVGLSRVPAAMYESARADGANWRQTLIRVTVPAALPAIAVAAFIRAVDSFRVFDAVVAVGDPENRGLTSVPSTLVLDGFIRRGEVGLGATLSVVSVVLAGVLAYAVAKVLRVRRAW